MKVQPAEGSPGIPQAVPTGLVIRQRRAGYVIISKEHLAELANLHRNTIGSLERGEVNISMLAIAALAKALRVKPADLIKTVRA